MRRSSLRRMTFVTGVRRPFNIRLHNNQNLTHSGCCHATFLLDEASVSNHKSSLRLAPQGSREAAPTGTRNPRAALGADHVQLGRSWCRANWNAASNWEIGSATTSSFPNSANDVADFFSAGLNYPVAGVTVTVPAATTFAVGEIESASTQKITISPGNATTSILLVEGPGSTPGIIMNDSIASQAGITLSTAISAPAGLNINFNSGDRGHYFRRYHRYRRLEYHGVHHRRIHGFGLGSRCRGHQHPSEHRFDRKLDVVGRCLGLYNYYRHDY